MDNLRQNLENDLLNLLNDFVRPTNQRAQFSQPTTARQPTGTTARQPTGRRGFSNDRTTVAPSQLDTQYYRLQLLNNILTDYNENINEYNRVMRSYINLVRDTFHETQPEPSAPQETPPEQPTPLHLRNPFNLNAFMSYVIYPVNEQPDNLLPTLSQEQINLATTTLNYTDDLSGATCPITLEEFREGDELCQIIHCSHIFRKPQLMNWFQRNVKCPVCRYDIRQWQSPTETEQEDRPISSNIINNHSIIDYSNNFDPSGEFVFDFYINDDGT